MPKIATHATSHLSKMEETATAKNAPQSLATRLKMRHLWLILALDDLGSVAKAAEALYMSPAAVFKARAEIEELIGMPIFKRQGQSWEPTLIGQQLINTAKKVRAEMECLNHEFLMLRDGNLGTLTIGTRTVSLQGFIAQTVVAMKKRHPTLTVNVFDGPIDILMKRLEKGEIDLVFSAGVDDTFPAQVSKAAITEEHHAVIASKDHPILKQKTITWTDALKFAWCLPQVGTRTRVYFDQMLTKWPHPNPINLVEANSSLMRGLLMQASPLLGVVPTRSAEQFAKEGLGSILPLTLPPHKDLTYLLWRNDLAMLPAARLYKDYVLDQIEHLDVLPMGSMSAAVS